MLRYYAEQLEANDGFRRPLRRVIASERTESVLLPYGAVGGRLAVQLPDGARRRHARRRAPGRQHRGLQALRGGAGLGRAPRRRAVARRRAARRRSSSCSAAKRWAGRWSPTRRSPASPSPARTKSAWRSCAACRGNGRGPYVVEMGGKNPAIVTASADVDAAAVAVARSAFGYGGQKCSACSRVYVARPVAGAIPRAPARRGAGGARRPSRGARDDRRPAHRSPRRGAVRARGRGGPRRGRRDPRRRRGAPRGRPGARPLRRADRGHSSGPGPPVVRGGALRPAPPDA